MAKILSLVLSVLMFLFDAFSAVFPGVLPNEPVENTFEICDSAVFEDVEEAKIIDDFVSWYETADRESEIYKGFGWEYFFNGSLALVPVELPCEECEAKIEAVENEEVLALNVNTVVCDGEHDGDSVKKIVVVKVNKGVSTVEVDETVQMPEPPSPPEEPEIPDLPELNGFTYGIFDSENFNDSTYNRSYEMIRDYNKWSTYYIGSDLTLNKYDEAFFADKNLAIVYIEIPADGKEVQLTYIEEDTSGRLDVDFRVKNGGNYNKGFVSAVIETDKSVSYVYPYEIGIKGEYVLVDAEFFVQSEIGLPKEDGASKIITSSAEYYRHITEDYLYLTQYSFSNRFFEDSNLALIYIMLPNMNGYYDFEVNMLSREEDGNALNIEYATVFEDVDEEDKGEAVKFFVMLVEIPKNITEINAVEKNFKNNYKTFNFTTFLGFSENTYIVSDYETWSTICKSDLPYFDKYDEEYFENFSVLLVREMLPTSGSVFDVIKVKENGDTLDLVYGTSDGGGGLQSFSPRVLMVEISKNITNVSAQRKEFDYDYYQGGGFTLEADSAILISDYSQWQTHSASTDSDYSKYDEAYFEDYSLVVVKSTNVSGEVVSIMRYLYEEDGVLNVGVCKHLHYGVGGLASVWYQVYVIEVDKNVTDVNLDIFY